MSFLLNRRKSFIVGGGPTPLTEYRAAVVADGATHYWYVDEASGTTATDSIGSLNGTISSTGIAYRNAGAIVDAASYSIGLNGFTSGIIVANDATVNTAQYSVEFWIRCDSIAINDVAVIKTNSGAWSQGFGMYFTADKVLNFFQGSDATLASTAALNTNQWYHIVGTYDATNIKIYVNGALIDTTAAAARVPAGQTMTWGYDQFFSASTGESRIDGDMDELAYYPSALTVTQILDHYTKSARVSAPLAEPSTYYDLIVSDGPEAYWRFDEASGTVLTDQINGHNGVISATGVTYSQSGALTSEPNNTMVLDGTQTMSVTDAVALRRARFSLECWVKINASLGNFGLVLLKTSSGFWSTGFGLHYETSGTNLVFWMSGFETNTAKATISTGAWTHVVCTYDYDSLRLYLNGSIGATTVAAAKQNVANDLRIGWDSFSGEPHLKDSIDELAIYGHVLTAAEVAAHYAAR